MIAGGADSRSATEFVENSKRNHFRLILWLGMRCKMKHGWQPIETSPMDRPILIREESYQPDLVRWQMKRPERMVNGNRCLAVPAGWFRLHGGRSHILHPTEWLDIPA